MTAQAKGLSAFHEGTIFVIGTVNSKAFFSRKQFLVYFWLSAVIVIFRQQHMWKISKPTITNIIHINKRVSQKNSRNIDFLELKLNKRALSFSFESMHV